MTQGEMMIWAAAFARHYGESEMPTSASTSVIENWGRDRAFKAADAASKAVSAARRAIEAARTFYDSDDDEMVFLEAMLVE